ncbi:MULTISPECIES: hypothetical protein [Rhizobium]|uniref:Uncharacterized protein n=3 Tax=Rhizobium TaxID=379 RepID=A0ABR6R6V5_RHITR|nr:MULTISPECIES: hypothetical protein [Rhizobium]MBB4244573.1 hypothetical protein [Rhizobium tropici]MBB4569930.1 hypothetical protein [Rhizobium leucaenae]MBB5596016.1 hypothetical protein [Rhizobium tropici]MBB6489434.1 hypothetical protein [Rhizobium lusitanum]MBB6494913.1 hypothetical protein [Rhizobium tropici]
MDYSSRVIFIPMPRVETHKNLFVHAQKVVTFDLSNDGNLK